MTETLNNNQESENKNSEYQKALKYTQNINNQIDFANRYINVWPKLDPEIWIIFNQQDKSENIKLITKKWEIIDTQKNWNDFNINNSDSLINMLWIIRNLEANITKKDIQSVNQVANQTEKIRDIHFMEKLEWVIEDTSQKVSSIINVWKDYFDWLFEDEKPSNIQNNTIANSETNKQTQNIPTNKTTWTTQNNPNMYTGYAFWPKWFQYKQLEQQQKPNQAWHALWLY